jgi:MFS family permease
MPRHAPSRVRSGLVAAVWEGAFAQVFITLTSAVFVVKFAEWVGAKEAGLGVVTAIPFLAQAIQVGTGWVYAHAGERRKGITAWTLLLARLSWLAPAALALGWVPAEHAALVLFATLAVSSLLSTTGAHGWLAWMGDLVPPPVRGRYFGLRNAVCAVVALVAAWLGGKALDAWNADGAGTGFAVAYAVAAVAGIGAYVAIVLQHHPAPRRDPKGASFRALWRDAWGKPENRRLFAFFAVWNVATGCAAPFWVYYMSGTLGMSSAAIAVQGTVGGVVAIFASRWWGRLVDRVGIRPVLLATAFCIGTIPFYWLFATRDRLWPVWVDAVAVGVFWPGFNLAAFNLPLAAAPARRGAVFLGIFAALTGVAFGVSCLAAGAVAEWLGPEARPVLGLSLTNLQIVFLASGVLRLASLALAVGLPDPKRKSLVFLVQFMGYAVRQRLNVGRQILTAPWKTRR